MWGVLVRIHDMLVRAQGILVRAWDTTYFSRVVIY